LQSYAEALQRIESLVCQVSLGCCDQSMNRLELIG
jgi:hypothetical protein